MALYIPAWTGERPQNGRIYLRAIRLSLRRYEDHSEVRLYIGSPLPLHHNIRGRTISLDIPTLVHDTHLFGGDVVLRADAQLLDDGTLEVTNLYLGNTPYPLS